MGRKVQTVEREWTYRDKTKGGVADKIFLGESKRYLIRGRVIKIVWLVGLVLNTDATGQRSNQRDVGSSQS